MEGTKDYKRGHNSAKKAIKEGKDAETLLGEARSSLTYDDWDRGWRQACRNSMAEKIVYVYNYKDLILITRHNSGEWRYHYSITRLVSYLNKKNGSKYGIGSNSDMLSVGVIVGWLIYPVINRCKIAYGDLPHSYDFNKEESKFISLTEH